MRHSLPGCHVSVHDTMCMEVISEYGGQPVAYKGLKLLRAPVQPGQDNGAVTPCMDITYRYIKSSPDWSQEFRQECGATQLESGDGELFDRHNSGLGCHKDTCRAVIIICFP